MTAFIDVAVVPMDQERVLADQTVLIEGSKITALGPTNRIQVPAGAMRINGRGKYLIPGLADMHAHIEAGDEQRIHGDDDSVHTENRLLYLWLANGVTSIRNVDFSERKWGERALRLKARVAAGELLSPRIYTAGPWTGMNGVSAFERVKPEQVASLVATYKTAGYDHIKIHEEGGKALFDSLVAAARREGIPLVGHVPYDKNPFGQRMLDWALAAPMKSIEHLEHLYFSGDTSAAAIQAVAAATKRANVWICPTWGINKVLERLPPTQAAYARRLVQALQAAGVEILLGTDSGKWVLTVHDELRLLVEEAGLTPYQALATGTRNVARYFGTLDSTGTVAVGKRADLVLLRSNPLTDIRNTANPIGTMIGGRWITPEEIAPRWAGLQRRRQYAEHLGTQASIATVANGITLTNEQQVAGRPLNRGYQAHRRALLDSLMSVTDTSTGHARLLQLLARRFGDYRTVLTSEQRTVFDANVRLWMMQSKKQGYSVAVPGVTTE